MFVLGWGEVDNYCGIKKSKQINILDRGSNFYYEIEHGWIVMFFTKEERDMDFLGLKVSNNIIWK